MEVEEWGVQGTMEFGRWPGPDYANIILPYGYHLNFRTSDGEVVYSGLKRPEEGTWYHYYNDPLLSEWGFTATWDESDWFNLNPGRAYEVRFWYWDKGTLCSCGTDMQWDPPST